MGRRRRILTIAAAVLVSWMVLPLAARGQDSQPTTTQAVAEELPRQLVALLETTKDYTYDFGDPGYYALLAFVKRTPLAPGFAREPIVVDDWQVLLERPSDFRGLPITIEGVVGRNKDPYTHPRHPRLGQVWQIELSRPDQAAACTVVFTSDVSDLPLGATIRVTGYFVKIRHYATKSQRPGIAALLVAPGPTQISRPVPPPAEQGGLDWRWMLAAVVVGLLLTLVLLRRASAGRRHDMHELRAHRSAPVNLADDLADWAETDRPGAEAGDAEEGGP